LVYVSPLYFSPFKVSRASDKDEVISEKTIAAIRERIIQYMQNNEKSLRGWFPIWWFKFHITGARDSIEIRRKLERMSVMA
jgi:hypothetical protein